jgi:aryl-alcohol dehydrogenase-like predicted oxidoreductase
MGAQAVAADSIHRPLMDYVTHNGVAVSRIGFGCAAIGGYDYGAVSDATSQAAVLRAVDAGVTLFDTADVYGFGHAETVLAAALGDRRKDVLIATKVGIRWDDRGRTRRDLRPEYITRAVDESLRRLRLDCLPLCQVHWPDPETAIEDSFSALRQLQEAGKIRWIGCCNVDSAYVARAQRVCRVESLQVPLNMVQREYEEALAKCRAQHSMLVMTYNALGQGLLTGKYDSRARFEGTDVRRHSAFFHGDLHRRGVEALERLSAVARHRRRSPAQVALRWVLQHPSVDVALAGMKSSEQVDENTSAVGWELEAGDLAVLAGAATAEQHVDHEITSHAG